MKINNYSEIIQFCRNWLDDDFTELWVFVSKIQDENEEFTFTELVEATKEVIRDLVINYKVRLVDEITEKPTDDDAISILSRIESLMFKLGKPPTIGDGIWFTYEE